MGKGSGSGGKGGSSGGKGGGGSGNKGGGLVNGPSQTSNPSGGGRGNNAPSK
jgi:hypothetical protein